MRIKLKGINSKQKRLAEGSLRTYYYGGREGRRCAVSPDRRNSWRPTTRLSLKRSRRQPACCWRCYFVFKKVPNFNLESRRAPAATTPNR